MRGGASAVGDSSLLAARCSLRAACSLLTAHYLRLTPYCVLPTAWYLLRTNYVVLPTAYLRRPCAGPERGQVRRCGERKPMLVPLAQQRYGELPVIGGACERVERRLWEMRVGVMVLAVRAAAVRVRVVPAMAMAAIGWGRRLRAR